MTKQILVISGIQNDQAQEPIWQDITHKVTAAATTLGLSAKLVACQDDEGLIDALASVTNDYAGVIIDTGMIAGTSPALNHAITQCPLPCIAVFMNHEADSALSSVCEGVIGGFGITSYGLAVTALCQLMQRPV